MVTLEEVTRDGTDYVEVRGEYEAIQPIIQQLKTKGGSWDPRRGVWYFYTLSPRVRKNLQKVIDDANDLWARRLKMHENQRSEVPELFKIALATDLLGYSFRKIGDGILLEGETYSVRDYALDAGGTWDAGKKCYLFDPAKVKVDKFKAMLSFMAHYSKELAVRLANVKEYLRHPKTWPTLGITMSLDDEWVEIKGNTRPYSSSIKQELQGVFWDGTAWKLDIMKASRATLTDVVEELDRDELLERARSEHAADPENRFREYDRKPLLRPDDCAVCNNRVRPDEGYLAKVYDEFEDDVSWKAFHTECRS